MPLQIDESHIEARLNLVREHVRCENRHDLDGIMQTFGATAEYHDLPWSQHFPGRDGVQSYYAQLLEGVPDLLIDVQRWHAGRDTVVLEVVIRGTHQASWRGLPATGRKLSIPLCGVFTFDEEDRLTSETIYYDRATVLRQLGVFHEPDLPLGKLLTVLTHPVTMARALAMKLRRT